MISQSRLRPHLLVPTIDDATIVRKIKDIKEHYTSKRSHLEDKAWDDLDVSSYACFYLVTNYQKFSFLLNKLPRDIFASDRLNFIDFGTGPGTYLLSFLDQVPLKKGYKLYGIDKNTTMVKQAKNIVDGLYPHAKDQVHFCSDIKAVKNDRPSVILFGHSMNELEVAQAIHMIELLGPQTILFLEPGTPYVYEKMMKLREYLNQQNYDCLYPCARIDQECPVIKREGDWCHQVWRGTHDEETERLSQKLKLDRRSMPVIAHAYTKQSISKASEAAQMVRYLKEVKHAFLWEVCLISDDDLAIVTFEIPKKTLSKHEVKLIKKVSTGNRFDYKVIKKIDPLVWRVSIELDEIKSPMR